MDNNQTVKSYETKLQDLKNKVKIAYEKLITEYPKYKNEEYDHEFLSDD